MSNVTLFHNVLNESCIISSLQDFYVIIARWASEAGLGQFERKTSRIFRPDAAERLNTKFPEMWTDFFFNVYQLRLTL